MTSRCVVPTLSNGCHLRNSHRYGLIWYARRVGSLRSERVKLTVRYLVAGQKCDLIFCYGAMRLLQDETDQPVRGWLFDLLELRGDSQLRHNIQVVLTEALSEATKDADSAFADLTTIIGDIPSALPQPDGAQRIHNVAAKLAVARHKLAEAQTRLTNYLDRGIVPEDLKRSG
jgi:hypothetical protein